MKFSGLEGQKLTVGKARKNERKKKQNKKQKNK